MDLIVDIIIIAIIALFIFWGYYRGLIGVAFKILTFFAAIIIALLLYKPVSNLIIEKTQIDENIEQSIIEKFSSKEDEQIKEEDLENMSEVLVNYIKNYTTEVQDATVSMIAKQVSIVSINVVVAIGLFIITKLILIIFRAISKILAELPIIKQFDKTGGIIYGLLQGILVVLVILAIISLCASMIENFGIISSINNSYIGKFLYNNNIILKILF